MLLTRSWARDSSCLMQIYDFKNKSIGDKFDLLITNPPFEIVWVSLFQPVGSKPFVGTG